MKFRINQIQSIYSEQKTKVAVDLLEQVGQLTRVKEKLIFDLPGILGGTELDSKITEFLIENGFAVPTVTG